MNWFRKKILFILVIIIYSIPLTVFAEGGNPPTPADVSIQANNSTTDSTLFQSASNEITATNNGKLSGFVWNDANKDGIYQTETEQPISGVSVYLYNSGNAISSTTTTLSGDYSFTGLAMSNYEIIISQNNFGSGSILSTKFNWNGSSKNNNFVVKSNDTSSWTSGTISLGNGETLANFGCGVYDPTKLTSTTTTTDTKAANANPKTADETLYAIPIIGLLGAIGVFFISRRKINAL